MLLLACGVPGPPVPPTPKIPQPPRDLVAAQRGERVWLRWPLPALHTDGSRLTAPQRAEVFRWFTENPSPTPEQFAAEAQPVHQIAEEELKALLRDAAVEFADALDSRELAEHAGRYAVYAVKALNRKNQDAGFSNLVAVRVYPVPTPIAQLATQIAEQAIELQWDAPTQSTSGTPLAAIAGYRIFRSSGSAESYQLIATAPAAHYDDTDFRFGDTYSYLVRTLAQYGTDRVESDDSAIATVTPRDIFAPPAPSNLVAIATPGRVDLTWDASPAADLAGYLVYRSEQAATGYQRLTPAAISVQSFSDASVAASRTYYYVVTAVDREGNQSPFSSPAAATTPQP